MITSESINKFKEVNKQMEQKPLEKDTREAIGFYQSLICKLIFDNTNKEVVLDFQEKAINDLGNDLAEKEELLTLIENNQEGFLGIK